MLRLRIVMVCVLAGGAVFAPLLGAPAARAVTGMPARPAQLPPDATIQLVEDTVNAWNITQGSGVTVAVLGSGVDPNAAGLQGKVTTGHDYVSLPYPLPLEGTIIAEAIAASGPTSGNPFGTLGRAPQAKILSIRVYPDPNVPGGQTFDNAFNWQYTDASAITDAVNSGAKVIYVTLVGYYNDPSLERAVEYAVSKGVVVIGDEYNSTGNSNELVYPAALPGVLGAGTVFVPDIPPPSSEVASPASQTILVGAPGNGIAAYGPDGSLYAVENYWAAGAWLTGTAALIKSVYPNLAPALVARAIALSARDRPAGGYDTTTGFGLINPAGALQEAATLAKLQGIAVPGHGVASPSARFVSSPAPGVIGAVHHSTVTLSEFGGAALLGLACLILAVTVARRSRQPAPVHLPATTPADSA